MPELLERARAYLNALEADRQAALAFSKEKAEQAKLLQAQLEMFGGHMPEGGIGVSDDRRTRATTGATEPAGKRRARRRIPELISRELSFSGQAMTVRQIAPMPSHPSTRRPCTRQRSVREDTHRSGG